jgi:hypothetical protein
MSKQKAVKVEGAFTEWYAPTFRNPYEDNADFRAYHRRTILGNPPVVGPAVDGYSEFLSGDLECLADLICDCELADWAKAKRGFKKTVRHALATGEVCVFKRRGMTPIKITPYAELPKIPKRAYRVYGDFAELVEQRVKEI